MSHQGKAIRMQMSGDFASFVVVMLKTPIGRLRLLALVEGLSLIVLVVVAVPLKYMFDIPQIVTYLGPVHGALFVMYVVVVMQMAYTRKWSIHPMVWQLIMASFIPFGNFYVDKKFLAPLDVEAGT
jgi:integral membrane protein